MSAGAGRWARRWNAAIFLGAVALVAVASAAGLVYVDRAGEALLTRQERDAVGGELDFLTEVQNEEGDGGLIRTIERRARLESHGRLYALMGGNGAIVAGNLARWPTGVNAETDWRSVKDLNSVGEAHVATAPLANGYVVLVGRDDSAQAEFRRKLLAAAFIAVAIVGATGVALGALVTEAILSSARGLSAVAMRVSSGDFGARAADAGDQGPFGDIARAQNAMLDRIENLVVGLRTVTDSLAHDLRTPLARLRRTLEAAAAAPRPDDWRAGLDAALAETDRTIAVFSSMVDVARAVGGLSSNAMSQVDLGALAQDVVDLFEPLAEENNLRLVVDIESAAARAHRPLIMQAFSNLVHNAIKYAYPDTEIIVSLGRREENVEFVVADRGPGIPPERRTDAVERFHRLRRENEASDGLGLGLAIVDACARLHGGALLLEDNEPGLLARLRLHASGVKPVAAR